MEMTFDGTNDFLVAHQVLIKIEVHDERGGLACEDRDHMGGEIVESQSSVDSTVNMLTKTRTRGRLTA